ncbi:hypothetical protein [Micromonospora sp. WMMD1082]|uniref:hypothetical protein n=1 Tax=Micromonospora sp. WMMD1082 TaxID=3016104 RepID=UPI002416CC17|nr:hypothetical protein [Micromonospora sp. WMMD1082]MDG4793075.1 hypothetical protein [Micromonospora sp. WMMD1082]
MQLGAILAITIPGEMQNALRMLRNLFDEETLPITLASLAVLISVWAALISRRSMKASERSARAAEVQARHAASQAEAAERQAVAASEQAYSASSEVSTAIQTSEISALEGAKARIDASLPRISAVIFKKNDYAGLAENSYALPTPLSSMPITEPVKLDHWSTEGSTGSTPHWAWDAFFVSHGLLFNFGNEPARVISPSVQFYAGTHPFTGEEVKEPATTIHGEKILYSGQSALFQVIARKQVDDWVQIIRKGEEEREFCEAHLSFFPADFDEPECGVKIRTTGIPLSHVTPEGVYAIFKPNSYFDVHLEFLRNYPDSPEEIAARLKGDREELFALYMKKQRMKWFREEIANRKPGDESIEGDADAASSD